MKDEPETVAEVTETPAETPAGPTGVQERPLTRAELDAWYEEMQARRAAEKAEAEEAARKQAPAPKPKPKPVARPAVSPAGDEDQADDEDAPSGWFRSRKRKPKPGGDE